MPDKPLEQLEKFAIDVILERRRGKRAAILRSVLWALSLVYRRLMRCRWWWYERRLARWHSVGCLTISVGNLTVGGTGKTPIVEQFARTLTLAGRRVAILSRGYKSLPRPLAQRLWNRLTFRSNYIPPRVVSDGRSLLLDSGHAGDEPFMLASNLRDVVVLVDKDRVKSALYAIRHFNADTLLLDDGYQYLPLKERLNVTLVDRHAPFGNEHVLPRGTLREPHEHLKRGDVIFVTKCDGGDITGLKERIREYNRHAEIIECAHRALYLQDLYTSARQPLQYLRGRDIGAVAGIAVPESFEGALRGLGANLIYRRHYADHHRYTDQEVTNAINRTRARGGHALLTTEKDAVRFPRVNRQDLPVYFLRVEIQLVNTSESLHDCLIRISGIRARRDIRHLPLSAVADF
ncbi:MAG: tetraacyldisaccharide 4'-kinase [Verrucomicrobiales bacterium]|nr:tetraacyldisaccharide 4'-kinase [Verrucomicrobiales bacterium]